MSLLIQGGLVFTGEGSRREGCDVLIENERITRIGPDLAPLAPAAVEIIDARRCIVMPGLINAHVHSNESFEQGATDNLPLELWRLRTYPPFDAPVLSERDHFLRAMLCAIISIKSGVTTLQDDVITPGYAAPAAVAGACRAYRDIGIRAWVTTSLGDVGLIESHPFLEGLLPDAVKRALAATPAPSAAEQLALFRHNFATWHGCEGRIRIILGPRAPQRCSLALLQGATELSEQCGVPVHTHVLETRTQAVSAQQQHGRTLIAFMRDIGMLTPRLTINHGIWLTAEDVALLAEHGCSVTHNPLSNLKLGSGLCPVRDLLDASVNVALGTDGMTTSDTADLLSAMRAAALLHKLATTDYTRWVSAEEAFRLATRGGAVSGLMGKDLGALEAGKLADVILLDRNAWSFLPLHDPITQLALSASPEAVLTSIVGGRVVMRDRKLLFVDEVSLHEEIAEAAERFRRDLHPKMLSAAHSVESVFAEMYRKAIAEPIPHTINPKIG